jgi:prepilin-type N-terminal cleavage/methylation domain-containing protein
MQTRAGFTLIELSIVLVIIGLIIGGVLVGRSLIEAAAIRAQIAQIEQFKTAVNTFRTKYNAIPGDMLDTTAAAVGMTYRSGQPGHGDGNGILEVCDSQSDHGNLATLYFGCETALFWRDLSDAGLVAGNFTGDVDDYIEVDEGQQEQYFPAAKIGNHNFISVFGGTIDTTVGDPNLGYLFGDAITYALVQDLTTEMGVYSYTSPTNPGVTPGQAFAIDSKIDDGFPATGLVWSSPPGYLMIMSFPGWATNNCTYLNGSTYYYQLSQATVDVPSCSMSFQ